MARGGPCSSSGWGATGVGGRRRTPTAATGDGPGDGAPARRGGCPRGVPRPRRRSGHRRRRGDPRRRAARRSSSPPISGSGPTPPAPSPRSSSSSAVSTSWSTSSARRVGARSSSSPTRTGSGRSATNLRQAFLLLQAAAKQMVSQGTGGAMAVVSSVDSLFAATNHVGYGAAKAGLVNLVKTFAEELGQYQIRVNAVLPGAVGIEVDRGRGADLRWSGAAAPAPEQVRHRQGVDVLRVRPRQPG